MQPSRKKKRLGPYQLKRVLGEGGMGRVYLATVPSRGDDTNVVIKVLRPDLVQDSEIRSMFLHEARLGNAIAHENIARMFDFGEVDGTLYLAMEYVDGLSLDSILSVVDPLPLAQALAVMADLASALGHAHSCVDAMGAPMNVVHRDVSPQNILISRDGRVKLIDFGVAKSAGQGHQTANGVLKGKLSYMAPEQFKGEVDNRTDIFAMGIVLHELVSGERLFKRITQAEIVSAILLDPIPDVVADDRTFEVLNPIAHRALMQAPDERYPDALELERDLRAAMEELDLHCTRQDLADTVADADARIGERDRTEAAPSGITRTDTGSGDTDRTSASGITDKSFVAPGAAERIPTVSTLEVPLPADDDVPETALTPVLSAPGANDDVPTAPTELPGIREEVTRPRPSPIFRPGPKPRSRVAIGLAALGTAVGLGAILIAALECGDAPPMERPSTAASTALSNEPATVMDEEAPVVAETRSEGGGAATTVSEAEGDGVEPRAVGSTDGAEIGETEAEATEATDITGPDESEVAARPRMGRLYLNTRPWSKISFNGRSLGQTPVVNAPLPEGVHVLRAEDGDGRLHRVRVRILAGRWTKRMVMLPRE